MDIFKIILLAFTFIGCNRNIKKDTVDVISGLNKSAYEVRYQDSDTLTYSVRPTKDYTLSLNDTNSITYKYNFSLNEEVLTKNKEGVYIDSLTTYLNHTREILINRNITTGEITKISIMENNGNYYSVKLDSSASNIVDFNWNIDLMSSLDYLK